MEGSGEGVQEDIQLQDEEWLMGTITIHEVFVTFTRPSLPVDAIFYRADVERYSYDVK